MNTSNNEQKDVQKDVQKDEQKDVQKDAQKEDAQKDEQKDAQKEEKKEEKKEERKEEKKEIQIISISRLFNNVTFFQLIIMTLGVVFAAGSGFTWAAFTFLLRAYSTNIAFLKFN